VQHVSSSSNFGLQRVRGCQQIPTGEGVYLHTTEEIVSAQPLRAQQRATEDGDRFCCEEGGRDAPWSLGLAQARRTAMQAWSRLVALLAMALLALPSLGMRL
jgi:hypothetical protein